MIWLWSFRRFIYCHIALTQTHLFPLSDWDCTQTGYYFLNWALFIFTPEDKGRIRIFRDYNQFVVSTSTTTTNISTSDLQVLAGPGFNLQNLTFTSSGDIWCTVWAGERSDPGSRWYGCRLRQWDSVRVNSWYVWQNVCCSGHHGPHCFGILGNWMQEATARVE